MEQENHVDWTQVAQTAGKVAQSAPGVMKNIRDKAKQKEAQKISDAGNYFTLRPYLKSLIAIPDYVKTMVANQGITQQAVLDLEAQGVGESNTSIISQLKTLSGTTSAGGQTIDAAGNTTAGTFFQKYGMYIIGVIILGIIIFFIVKRK
jgi:hypothetical protein